MKKMMLVAWLAVLFTAIAVVFWYNEYRYQLPTPVPQDYHPISSGTIVEVPTSLATAENKPVFLHFFNPDCPCSRFNIPHFLSLQKQFGKDVDFAVVVLNNDRYTAAEIQHKLGANIPVSFDTMLAKYCGVYSTPQAVILDASHRLYYRGNYNKSRYCTDKRTNYAQSALEGLLANKTKILFDKYAMTAYGCQLPQCTKN